VSTDRWVDTRDVDAGDAPGEDAADSPLGPRLAPRQFALHGGTTGALALVDDIATAGSAGFDAIEIADDKLATYLAHGGDPRDLKVKLSRLGLYPLSLYDSSDRATLVAWRDPASREWWRAFCARAAAVGCAHVIVTPGRETPGDGTHASALARALAAMTAVGDELGLRTALEFRGFSGSVSRTLADARELVDTASAPARFVLDAYHFHVGGSTASMLDGLDADSVALVRLADADSRPPKTLTDGDRLLPGDGVIPLRDLVRRIEALGVEVPYSLNLSVAAASRPDPRGYADWDVSRLALVARESAEALCAEVDEQDGRLDYG
jgi:2-keto-myo-inositol isomerase